MQALLSMAPEQRNSVKSQYHCATLVGNWEEERRGFGAQDCCDAEGFSSSLQQPPTSGGRQLPIAHDTTYTYSFKPNMGMDTAPSSCLVAEAPRELLFYHGDLTKPTEKNLATISEMSFTNHHTEVPYTNDEILDLATISNRNDRSTKLKRSMGLGSATGEDGVEGTASKALLKESALIRSFVAPAAAATSNGSENGMTADSADSSEGSYTAPRLPPIGRVATREALLTTKNVTIDATGEHLKENLLPYPLTSSVCVGRFMASKNDPMHKTKLRVEYELTK